MVYIYVASTPDGAEARTSNIVTIGSIEENNLETYLKTVDDNLLSSIGGVFQTVGAAKWNAFHETSKRKSGMASSSMLVDRVVGSDVLRCNSSDNS